MKKALIITYYWPPGGGAGVYRWLKFSQHMQEFGWEPVIYTPTDPALVSRDESLLADVDEKIVVLKQPIFEPLEVYSKLFEKNKKNIGAGLLSAKKTSGWKSKLLFWIRGNLFIPDPRRFWIRPSVKYLKKYLAKIPVDVIISTGPPHSLHLIAYKIHKATGIKWLADFRDPWTNIDYYKQLNLTWFADKINHRFERKVVTRANLVVTVSNSWAKELEEIRGRQVRVITNGFDEKEFANLPTVQSQKFTLTHIGSMNNDRNPFILWNGIKALLDAHHELKEKLEIKLIGPVDYRVFEFIENCGLTKYLVHLPYVAHKEIIAILKESAVLLLLLNNTPNVQGIIPGKLFEYLAVQKPILAIGPEDGDSAQILDLTGAGKIADYNNEDKLTEALENFYKLYTANKQVRLENKISDYSRRNLTKQLCVMLDHLTDY